MADTDGKVRIIIDTNAQQAAKELNNVGQAFKKNADTIKSSSSAYNSYEKAVRDNIQVLRELAIGGNQNTEGFKKLAAETKKYQDALRQANSEVDKAVGGMSKQSNPVNALTSSLKGLIGAYIGLRGIQAVTQYVVQSTEAFRTHQNAVSQLNITLANAGIYTTQYSQEIQKLANEIQSYSNFGNEAVIKAVAVGQAFAGQTKITEALTKATVDFAAANDMDLDQAFTLVGKSIGSNTNALARYGVELNKNMSDSQKAAAIATQLGNRYEGTAQQVSNASIQMQNAVGDLAKTFGSLLNPAVLSAQKHLISFINTINSALGKIVAIRNKIYEFRRDLNQRQLDVANKYNLKNEAKYFKSEVDKYNNLIKQSSFDTQNVKNKKTVKYTDDVGFSGGGAVASTKTAGARTTATSQAKQIKDAYEQAQEAVNNARRAVQNAALTYGTSSQQVQQAFQQYQQANEKLSAVDDLFKVTETKTKFQELNQQITDTTAKLQDLYLSGEGKSDAFKETKNKLVELQTQLQDMNTAITSSVGLNWQNVANSIRSNLTSALLTPLQQGESAFDRLGKIGLNVVQMIGQEIISNLLKQITLEKTLQTIKTVGKGIGGFFGGLFGSANGNVFRNGNVVPFARGGVVTKPTVFPMANGAGLMGEAGAEAIMPLTRRNGKLGVEGSAMVVNIYNQSGANVETQRHDDGSVDVFIRRVNDALSNQRTSKGFRAAYQREDRKGVQAC